MRLRGAARPVLGFLCERKVPLGQHCLSPALHGRCDRVLGAPIRDSHGLIQGGAALALLFMGALSMRAAPVVRTRGCTAAGCRTRRPHRSSEPAELLWGCERAQLAGQEAGGAATGGLPQSCQPGDVRPGRALQSRAHARGCQGLPCSVKTLLGYMSTVREASVECAWLRSRCGRHARWLLRQSGNKGFKVIGWGDVGFGAKCVFS